MKRIFCEITRDSCRMASGRDSKGFFSGVY